MPSTAPSGFVPIHPNPFIVGNPVRDRSMFFGREAEFELVRKRCQDADRGELLVFCGERRSGKTSILFQITDGRLGPDFIPVLIDMQSMAVASEADFLTKICDEVLGALGPDARGIKPPEFTPGAEYKNKNKDRFQRFIVDVLRVHPAKKLILLFDEYELFENKIDAGVLDPEVLDILKHLIENRSVFLIFTGSQHIEARRQDYWRILHGSIFKAISYLDREDALSLIRKPVEGVVRYGEGTLDQIYRLTAGQPFYTQAVCQSLVDRLNESKSNDATMELLDSVVTGLVDNPLPQMIFLWDSLERDEKLVLALLAECLTTPDAFVPANVLARTIRQRDYPLDLSKPRIAILLAKLFRSELLLQSGTGHAPSYAFRMDLWRLWIKRMHSVWQVMREEGFSLHPPRLKIFGRSIPWTHRARLAVVIVPIVLVAVVAAFRLIPARNGTGTAVIPPVPPAPGTAVFSLEVTPAEAEIHMDGKLTTTGRFADNVGAGKHEIRMIAKGYADSVVSIDLPAGGQTDRRIALRALVGVLKVDTDPAGALIRIDGAPKGRSPVTLNLAVPTAHEIEASYPGRATMRMPADVMAGATKSVRISLPVAKGTLHVSSSPSGARVSVDNSPSGTTPLTLGLSVGKHVFRFQSPGRSAADTSIEVREGDGQLFMSLQDEPPGELVVMGSNLARMIFVDGNRVIEDVQNSGLMSKPAGPHRVQVVLANGQRAESTIVVRSQERAVYDYTERTVKYIHRGGQ